MFLEDDFMTVLRGGKDGNGLILYRQKTENPEMSLKHEIFAIVYMQINVRTNIVAFFALFLCKYLMMYGTTF